MKEEKVICKPYNIKTNKQTKPKLVLPGATRGHILVKNILVGTAGNHRLWLARGLSVMHAHDSQDNCSKSNLCFVRMDE